MLCPFCRHDDSKVIQLRDDIDEATIERASALFNRVNALLPLNGPMNGASTHSIGFQRTRAVA